MKNKSSPHVRALTFTQLRDANVRRLPTFRNAQGYPYHKADGSDWTLGEWANALGGEVGEAANIIKKIHRGDFELKDVIRDLMDEMADIMTYIDIIAFRAGIEISSEKNFDELRASTIHMYHNAKFCGMESKQSLSEMHTKLFRFTGDICFIADQVREGRAKLSDIRKRLSEYISSLVKVLDCVCYVCGIDLGKAVVVKFNAVSSRVKSPVFIDLVDLGRPLKCKLCGNIFAFDRKTAKPHLRYEDSYWSQPCTAQGCTGEERVIMVPGEAADVAKAFR